jgi:hypothetical protein
MNLWTATSGREEKEGICSLPVHLALYVMVHGHFDQTHPDGHDDTPKHDGVNGLCRHR